MRQVAVGSPAYRPHTTRLIPGTEASRQHWDDHNKSAVIRQASKRVQDSDPDNVQDFCRCTQDEIENKSGKLRAVTPLWRVALLIVMAQSADMPFRVSRICFIKGCFHATQVQMYIDTQVLDLVSIY